MISQTTRTLELQNMLDADGLAKEITQRYSEWNMQRTDWKREYIERKQFLYATDTSKTSISDLPWKNKTTLPKLTQIMDNLHANYNSALFPNDDWMKWEAHSLDSADVEKKRAIQAYMSNKVRESGFRNTVSQLLYDYIMFGNVIGDIEWVNELNTNEFGESTVKYVGPRLTRISPLDIVIDPTSISFQESPKITRTVKHFGELKALLEEQPNLEYIQEAVRKGDEIRSRMTEFTVDDFEKAETLTIEGFGNLMTYFASGMVEILEFEGTIHDPDTGKLLKDHVVTIMDRKWILRKEPINNWFGKSTKQHVPWRRRVDNLWGMGPLDNLVGMQYRIDHLENLKADVFDLIAFPPLKIIGEVEEFVWEPGAEIFIDEGGDVQMLAPATAALQADTQIAILEQKMEEFAGAPRQAMGIRTPGEKTAFEVQALENAAGRIFQEKVTQFEVEFLEPILNAMLELARRNLDGVDVVRVMDDDLGVAEFLNITKEDITAKGKLRPIGARHFAARAQILQNLTGVTNSGIWPKIERHFSDKQLAKLVEDVLQVERFQLVQDNAALFEQAEAAQLTGQLQEETVVQAQIPVEEEGPLPPEGIL